MLDVAQRETDARRSLSQGVVVHGLDDVAESNAETVAIGREAQGGTADDSVDRRGPLNGVDYFGGTTATTLNERVELGAPVLGRVAGGLVVRNG